MKEYMKDVTAEQAIKCSRRDTLCWDCKNACRGGCSWFNPEVRKPVDDWVAMETDNGFIVRACPQFIRETYGAGTYRTADDYILALEIAVTDRNNKIKRMKNTPDLLRKKIAKLQRELDMEQWRLTAHMSD